MSLTTAILWIDFVNSLQFLRRPDLQCIVLQVIIYFNEIFGLTTLWRHLLLTDAYLHTYYLITVHTGSCVFKSCHMRFSFAALLLLNLTTFILRNLWENWHQHTRVFFTGILIILQRMKVLRSLGSRLPVFSKCTVNGNGNIMLTNHSLLRDHDFYQARTPTKYFSLTSHVFRTTCSKKRIFIDKADELHPTY